MGTKFFIIAPVVIVGTRALLHRKADVPYLQSWEDFQVPPDAGAIPGVNVGPTPMSGSGSGGTVPISDGQLPPDFGERPPEVNFDHTPISDGQSEGILPPEVSFDHTPISDGQSEGILPPEVNFDHTPVSNGESEGILPPEVNFDHTPYSDGESEGILPPEVNFDHTPYSDGQSEGILPPDASFDPPPTSDGESKGALLPAATPGQVVARSEVGEGIVSLVPNDNLICYQAPRSDMDGMLQRLRESPLSGLFGGVELSAAPCKDSGFQSRIGQTCFGDTFAKSYDLGPHMTNELALRNKAREQQGGGQAPPRIQCIECDGHC